MSQFTDPLFAIIHKKLQQQPLSVTEEQLLQSWLQQQGEGVFNSATDDEALRQYLALRLDTAQLEKAKQQFRNTIANDYSHENTAAPASGARVRKMQWSLVAAFCALCLTAIVLYWMSKQAHHPKATEQLLAQTDALPGSDKAILTLANGKKVELDNTSSNVVQDGTLQVVNKGGQLNYEGATNETTYHTLSTPRGGQFKLLLPDGTAVWLNAASSITYPTAFTGNNRTVTITGELYFEVAKDKTKPFIVKVHGAEVEVLGTHFNVNSYSDEPAMRVTLLEGKVMLKSEAGSRKSDVGSQQSEVPQSSVTLKPGEQGIAAGNSPFTIDHSPDLSEVMAWKNGSFQFNRASLQTVMRQLSRWYDVDIVYEQKIPDIQFEGDMKRNLTLTQILEGLQQMGIHFNIQGKQLIVTP